MIKSKLNLQSPLKNIAAPPQRDSTTCQDDPTPMFEAILVINMKRNRQTILETTELSFKVVFFDIFCSISDI